MTAMLRAELFKLSRRTMPRVLVLIQVLSVAALYLLLWSVIRTQNTNTVNNIDQLREGLSLSSVPDFGMALVFQVGSVLVVILASALIGSEYGWGTIRAVLARAPNRTALVTAKLLTLAIFAGAIVVLGLLTALATSALITSAENLPGGGFGGTLVNALAATGRTMFAMLPYLALAFLIALWTRSTAAGIGIGLALLLVEAPMLALIGSAGGPLEQLPKVLLSQNVSAVLAANSGGSSEAIAQNTPASNLPNPWQGAAALLLYTVVFVALAYLRFRRRDITSG